MSVAYAEAEQATQTSQSDRIPFDELTSKLPSNIEISDEPGVLIIREGWLHVGHFVGLVMLMIVAGVIFSVPPHLVGTASKTQAAAPESAQALPRITPRHNGNGADTREARSSWTNQTTKVTKTLFGRAILFVASLQSLNTSSAIFWSVYAVLTYVALAGFVNHTTLQITEDYIERSVGPLPWSGTFFIDVEDVDQLYAVRRYQPWRHLSSLASSGLTARRRTLGESMIGPLGRAMLGPTTNFIDRHTKDVQRSRMRSAHKLMLLKHDGTTIPITCAYKHLQPARVLEYLVEARMSIPDRPVAAEARL